MPIYEYVCQDCGQELEKLQKISDEPLTVCPRCSEPKLKRKISAVGFRLKGGGWYETDFKSGDRKNLAGESAAAASDKPSASSETAAAPSTTAASGN